MQEKDAKAKEAFDNNYHIVQKGESLTEISNKYGVNLNYLIEMNELEDPDSIKVGSKIFLTKKNTITKINEGKNNYGPLTIEQTELKKLAGRMTLDVKNEETARLGGVANVAEGGLIGKKSGPPPESGPNPQGLLSLIKRDIKI